MIYMGIPHGVREVTESAMGNLIYSIYGIPLKWEPKGAMTVWCESQMGHPLKGKGFSMTRKDIVHDLYAHVEGKPCEWD